MLFLILVCADTTRAQSAISSGALYTNSIAANETNAYTFSADSGDSLVLRVGRLTGNSAYFEPWLRLYGPDGALVGSVDPGNGWAAEVALTATNSGTFTVFVSDGSYGGYAYQGTYELNYFKVPGSNVVSAGDEGGPLANGTLNPGTITTGDIDAWTFSAVTGDSLVVRVGRVTGGSAYFEPWLRIYGPDGALVGSVDPGNVWAAEAALTATNSGTFTVLVSDGSYGGYGDQGTYDLTYVKVPGSNVVSAGDEGGALTNGTLNPGTISAGDVDVWTFGADGGDSLVLRVGRVTGDSAYFEPWLRVYGPSGALLGSVDPGTGWAAEVALTATNSGTFTVLVADGSYGSYANQGTYQLTYIKVPGSNVVSAGDEGGPLTNGTLNPGTISSGDIDAWTFAANSGDSVVLRVGEVSGNNAYFEPWLRVYGPDGLLLGAGDTAGTTAQEIVFTATNNGTFTVLVSDGNYGGIADQGTYELNYFKVPGSTVVSSGDEGGPLTNGTLNPGTIATGDIDAWTFSADSGDSLVLRVGRVTGNSAYFEPWLRVYGPDGALVGSADPGTSWAAEVAVTATNSGTFTVLVSDGTYGGIGSQGTYELTYVKVPGSNVVSAGDEGGTLTNGTLNAGTITTGDMDAWTFPANQGDSLVLRVGRLSSDSAYFEPWLQVYGPDGTLVGSVDPGSTWAAEVAFSATNSGTFTVLVSDGSYGGYGSQGTYQLNLAHAPGDVFVSVGDEGGVMNNGFVYTGTNSIADLDVWSFYGTIGDSNMFRIATTNFTPYLRLYGPAGDLVAQAFTANTGNRTNYLSYTVTNNGNYTLVSSAYYIGQSGTYGLKQSRVPPDLIVPDTQILTEGDALNVPIWAQDPDIPNKALSFRKISTPPGVILTTDGNTNATVTWATDEATGPSTNTITLSVTDTVNGQDFIRTNSFTVIVNELNEPPMLTVPGTQFVDELTPLNVNATATDVDIPANPLTYSLVSPPPGLTINPDTGAIAWTPTEAQGSNTYTVTVVVTDSNPPAINATHLSTTNSFTVVVREVNLPPQLTVPGNQVVTELNTLSVSASAFDADLPPNPLTFALVSSPSGMTINPNSGAITWTPTEAQGPNDYTVGVSVTDFNPTAVNAQHLSVTNTFLVTVNESNTPPRFTSVPSAQTITELTPLNVTVTAADDDLPANPLTYALLSPPTGMTINSSSGAIAWTPTEAQGSNTYTITVTVADTNALAINQKQFVITNSFQVTVNESNSPPRFVSVPSNQTITEETPLNVTVTAVDDDIPANPLTYALIAPPTGMNINPVNGDITWTPTEAQGPDSYTIKFTVVDTNAFAINQKQFVITNSFQVTVTESNRPPVLAAIADQSVHYGVLLSVQASASDPDIPTNTLTFSLAQAPTGMVVNAGSGLITWTPAIAQVGTYPVTLRVEDNGTPSLSATQTFTVMVTGEAAKLAIKALAGNLKQITVTGDVGLNYDLLYSTNLLDWAQLLHFNLSTSPYPYIDPGSATEPKRFYRLKLDQ